MLKTKNIFVLIKGLMPYFIILLLSLAFTFPIFKSLHNLGRGDWDLFCYNDEVPRKTILEYHQFPLMSPYSWGGYSLIREQQAGYLRPTFLFTLLFGCVIGLKIELFFIMALGMVGMFLLSRYYKMSTVAGLLTASIFGFSGFFSLQISEGHVWAFPFMYTPFVFLFLLRSFEKIWFVVPSAIFLVLIIFAGGSVHVIPPICLFLGTYVLVHSIQNRNLRPIFSLAIILLLAFGLGAVKILPALEQSIEHPRLMDTTKEKTTLKGLYHIFLDREQNFHGRYFKEQKWSWWEYGAYTGVLPLILFLLALIFFWKKETPLIFSGLFAFFVSLGDFSKWAPWRLLHKLPLLSSTRVPSRFIIIFVFTMAILSGLAFELFYRKVKHFRKTKFFLIAIAIFIILDLLIVNTKPFTHAFPNSPIKVSQDDDFHQIRDYNPRRSGAYSSMYLNLLSNIGTLNGYIENADVKAPVKAAEDEDYRGEVYLQDGGQATYKYWSPNRLVVNLETENEARLIINQNYNTAWRVKGKVAENFNGLLSAMVTPSDKTVEFYYLPAAFMVGLTITLISTILIIVFTFKHLKS